MENTGLWIPFTIIVGVYYYIIWFLFGQDKISDEKSLGKIPDDIDPVMAHYLMKKYADSKTTAIGFVSLALDGYIDINDDDGEFLIYKRKEFTDEKRVAEKFIFDTLFYNREYAVLGTYDFHKCISLKYGLNKVFSDSHVDTRFIKKNKLAHLSVVLLGIIFIAISAFYNDVISITSMFIVSGLTFFWLSNPFKTYTEDGRIVVSTLEDLKNKGDASDDVLWAMTFENEYYLDGKYDANSFDWFGAFDGPLDYLTAMQREENRKEQAKSFISWLSENIVDTLNSVSSNSKTLFEKGRRKGFRNPAAEKREKKQGA